MKTKRVFVQPEQGSSSISGMFFSNPDYVPTKDRTHADLIVFIDGADVDPALYGFYPHRKTITDSERDKRDADLFRFGRSRSKALIGIGRGAHFLNVMQRGVLYQDVNNHDLPAPKTHGIVDVATGKKYHVSSNHHQMMLPGPYGVTMAWCKESTERCSTSSKKQGNKGYSVIERGAKAHDSEVIFYPKDRILCFQPRPDFSYGDTQQYFFNLMLRTLWKGE
jgi:hypothetical protein